MKTFSLGNTVIDIADFLETRIEEDTLVAFWPESDFANVRFSKLTLQRDGKEVQNAGKEMIESRAAKFDLALNDEGEIVWYYTTQESSEGAPWSIMHYWYVGLGSHVVIASCFIDSAKADTNEAKQVLDSMLASVRSIRQKPRTRKKR
ncbi:MAG: hypothetical protein IPK32_08355 [Verrucomicrobiaceae bacterium]|nr:hypothetical protein [Verrucomicrobiaceae bacterium]